MLDTLKIVENVSRRVALKYLYGNIYVDDVIQQTMIQYYLNRENVNLDNLVNWVYTVSKNLCIDFHKADKNKRKLLNNIQLNNQVEDHPEDDNIDDQKYFMSILDDLDNYTFLNETDKKILKKYIPKKYSLTKLSKCYRIKKNVLKNRIYSALREIKFYRLLDTDVIDFDTIPGTKMHVNIKNFVSKIERALKNNNLDDLKNYSRNCLVHDSISQIDIKKVCGYRLTFYSRNNYRLAVLYKDNNDQNKVFGILFSVVNNKNIQIVEIPIIPRKVVSINPQYASGNVGQRMLTNSKGVYNERIGDITKDIDPSLGKVIQEKKN